MKKLLLLGVVLGVFSQCQNADVKTDAEKKTVAVKKSIAEPKTKISFEDSLQKILEPANKEEFWEFWKKFRAAVEEDDKEKLKGMTAMISTSKYDYDNEKIFKEYESIFSDFVKKEIKAAQYEDLKIRKDDTIIFTVTEEYEDDWGKGTFHNAFIFGKINSNYKWISLSRAG